MLGRRENAKTFSSLYFSTVLIKKLPESHTDMRTITSDLGNSLVGREGRRKRNEFLGLESRKETVTYTR